MTDTPSSTRAVVLRRQALIAIGDLGDANRAYELLDAAEADAIAMNDGALRGRIQSNRADIDLSLGRDDGIEVRLYDAIALLEEFGDTYFSVTLQTLADLCVTRAKYEEADELLRRAEATEPPWHELLNIKLRRTGLALTRGQVDSASEHAASALDLAERSEEPEFVNSAVLAAAWVALARGEIALAEELCTRTVDQAREHDLFGEMHALVALAIVSVVHGDLALASKCGDGIQEQPLGKSWFGVTDVRLASSFVALAVGEVDRAEDVTMQVLADADREGMPYLRVVSLEMLAAVKASSDPSRAWQLLEDADRMRTAIGAAAWPFEPYRYVALRTLEGHRASIDAPVLGK